MFSPVGNGPLSFIATVSQGLSRISLMSNGSQLFGMHDS